MPLGHYLCAPIKMHWQPCCLMCAEILADAGLTGELTPPVCIGRAVTPCSPCRLNLPVSTLLITLLIGRVHTEHAVLPWNAFITRPSYYTSSSSCTSRVADQ
jgi:hypothetical protein